MATGRRGWNLRKGATHRVFLRGSQLPQWKGDAASPNAKRLRARKLFPLGPCQQCGAPGVDRHHVDGNTGNNTPVNIMILCRRCHMTVDGRLQGLISHHERLNQPKPAKLCGNCRQPSKPLRRGRCTACAQYFRLNHIERPMAFVERDNRRKQAPQIPGLKWCSGCERSLSRDNFYRDGSGVSSRCKSCRSEADQRRRQGQSQRLSGALR